MRKKSIIILLMAFIFNACNFSVGTHKDLMSGLKLSNNGLSYTEGYLSMDNARLSSNEFAMGKVVYVFFDGLEGFTEAEGKVYPAASMVVTDESGNTIVDYPNMLEQAASGVSAADLKQLSFKLTVGNPMETGKKYLWKSKIWDTKGEGTIEAESEFIVK